MPTEEEIFSKVQEALVDALGVDDDEVTPEATLEGDLGAESIDFLDIIFRLEKSFDIKIPQEELFPQEVFASETFVVDGAFTDEGFEEIQKRVPFVDFSEYPADRKIEDFRNFLTVDALCKYVASKAA